MAEFTGKRYITSGIENEIPAELQIMMWDMVDKLRHTNQKLDYLQIFVLRPVRESGVEMQEIVHKQELPWRMKKITVESGSPISAKIFVIDNIDYITMLLSQEY